MPRRPAYLHLGPSRLGADLVHDALVVHRDALAAQGVRRPGTPDDAFRAAVELARDHRSWGYRRREVEGAWAGVCREAHRARRARAVVVSERLLAPLTPPQVDLALDQLAGFQPHLVLTVAAPDLRARAGDPATDLVDVLDRWAPAVGDPGRVHVLVVPPLPREEARATLWRHLGEVLGLDPALPVPASPGVTPAAATDATPTATSTATSTATAGPAALDEEAHARLTRLALTWIGALATSGHDVHGDLADLMPPTPPGRRVPGRAEERPALPASVRLPGVLVGRA